ncbi:Ig-like domain repeat protein [Nocardioides sp. LHG3406-4]|uniref:Ig-like domain repeat protein n=1 Tax=Nocardioides sp. LHG3406-4 TaxID=2804575 RepID=UPI003CEDE125
MRVLQPQRRRSRPVSNVVALLVATLVAIAGLSVAPTAAHAADDDVVAIPDANLKAAANKSISTSRSATQDITYAEAAALTSLTNSGNTGAAAGIADLTGLGAFTNLTSFVRPVAVARYDTFGDLSQFAGLTKLNILALNGTAAGSAGQVSDLSPLANLTALQQLTVGSHQLTGLSTLPDLPNLTALTLSNNKITSLAGIPSLPKLVTLNLLNNGIKDVTPLVGKFDPEVLATINLSGNKVTNASALAPLGENGARLGASSSSGTGLVLTRNRIKDFSAFSSWVKPPTSSQVNEQSVYAGPYRAGGISVTLKDADATVVPTVDPAAGAYDPATGKLTITDPAAESVVVSPNWTVLFNNPPVDPGDETGPQIEVAEWPTTTPPYAPLTDAPQIGQTLRVSDPGSTWATIPCAEFSYRWLRDGEEFAPVRNWVVDNSDFGSDVFTGSDELGGSGQDNDVLGGAYTVSATDVGHVLSVRVTCDATGVTSSSTPTAVVTAEAPEKPVVQDLEAPTTFGQTTGEDRTYRSAPRSGVVGDPTNPTIPIYIGQLGANGTLVDPTQLTVALTNIRNVANPVSGCQACPPPGVISADEVAITGTGAERTIVITPTQAPAVADLRFTVTGTTGTTTTFEVGYKTSMATTETSRVLLGVSDASSAIGVGDGYLMVADDEKRSIRLYNAEVSGREVSEFGLLGGSRGDTSELDAESAARKGDSIWWFGSHGKDKDNKNQPSRQQIFQTTLTGTGAEARLTQTGTVYTNLKNDLIEWDQNHGNRFDLAAGGSEQGHSVNALDGFNIEAAEFSPNDSALYLGFRAPISPTTPGGKALIVPVTNLEDLTAGTATKAHFGEAILLDLGGDSIREIRKNARDEYLILSGKPGEPTAGEQGPKPQTLWAWNGEPGTAPRKLTTQVPFDVQPEYTDNAGAWEGIGEMPERLTPGAPVRLIMDQGYDVLYRGGGENKDDGNDYTNKARTDIVTLAGPAGTVADLSDPGAFPDQVVNSIGSARTVTVTNAGSNLLYVGAVSTSGADESATDFLVAGNSCTGKTLDPEETCTIQVRFAPSRVNATSEAELVVESDVPGGKSTVPLTGKAIAAPPGGGGGGGGGGPTVPQKVNPAVSAGSTTVSAGEPASITVQVTGSGSAQPTGAVTLRNGAQSVGSATLALGSATLTVPASALSDGVNLFTAEYAGDSAYNGSGARVLVTVDKATAKVTAKPTGKVVAKRKAALKVTVKGPVGITPTGLVTVLAGGKATTVRLTHGRATVRVTFKSAGNRAVFLSYAGNADLSEATSIVKVKVNPAKKKKHKHGRATGTGLTASAWRAKMAPILN